ncbi:hypothetical protein N7468_006230 [Penicillium chermesinum]|uniref:Ankyrin n=1 Tax=Penicillium chermesinum TaxID=63820 RepID=A0A9W9TKY2_9EURO|nr:uncharacterized protein N7468_006230 [Penicillium chermesinum]KAJ5225005.1 hypothetical protein N7468_006230 [Penicillium chermesinum]
MTERLFSCALLSDDIKPVEMMLKAGMDPNRPVNTGFGEAGTPLEIAAQEENVELLELLISFGADVNLSVDSETPPLYHAILGICDTAPVLLSHGAIPTFSCVHELRLWNSNRHSGKEVILATPDVNIRAPPELGYRYDALLPLAVVRGSSEVVELLLAKGATVNGDELFEVHSDDCPPPSSLLPGECRRIFTTLLGLVSTRLLRRKSDLSQSTLETLNHMNPGPNPTGYMSPLTLAHGAMLERNTFTFDGELKTSPLMKAIQSESVDILELLILSGARFDDRYTQTPDTLLGAALETGNMVMFDYLLAHGAVNMPLKMNKIPSLRVAVYMQQNGILQSVLQSSGPRILTAVLDSKRDVDIQLFLHLLQVYRGLGHYGTHSFSKSISGLLEVVIGKDQNELLCALLEIGALVTEEAVIVALEKRPHDLETARLLLSRFWGYAPSAVGNTIALFHQWYGKDRYGKQGLEQLYSILAVFRSNGISPRGVPLKLGTERCFSPRAFKFISVLDLAAYFRDTRLLKILIEWAPWDSDEVGHALVYAIQREDFGFETTRFLMNLSPRLDIEAYNYSHRATSLQAAVTNQLLPVVRDLAPLVDVNYLGEGGRRRTPLQLAVEKGNLEIIDILLEHGARIDGAPAETGGATALQLAAIKGFFGIARKLIDLGADVNEPAAKYEGRTALQGAAEYGRIDMLKMLFDEGVVISGKGAEQYKEAIRLAEKNAHWAAAKLLRSFSRRSLESDSERRNEEWSVDLDCIFAQKLNFSLSGFRINYKEALYYSSYGPRNYMFKL